MKKIEKTKKIGIKVISTQPRKFLLGIDLSKNKVASITSILILIGIVFSAWWFIENRYALSSRQLELEKRLDYKIVSDQYWSIQDRIWRIMDRCPQGAPGPVDPTAKEEMRTLFEKRDELKRKLDILERK
jgi:hypothetical protein